MKGSIRFFVGLVICMGAVEANPETSIAVIIGVALVGLAIMASGAKALKEAV
jgi:hypothetical protein